MPNDLDYYRKADALLNQAASAANMGERSRLIDEAIRWRLLAIAAEESSPEDADCSEASAYDLEHPAP